MKPYTHEYMDVHSSFGSVENEDFFVGGWCRNYENVARTEEKMYNREGIFVVQKIWKPWFEMDF